MGLSRKARMMQQSRNIMNGVGGGTKLGGRYNNSMVNIDEIMLD